MRIPGVTIRDRPLLPNENQALQEVFAAKLDLTPIRLAESTFSSFAFAFANTIHFPRGFYKTILPKNYYPLLIHEATHVYQYQRSGDYFFGLKPLYTYVVQRLHGDYDPYDIAKEGCQKLHWQELTPDEQAEILTEIYRRNNAFTPTYQSVSDKRLQSWYNEFQNETKNRTQSITTGTAIRQFFGLLNK